MIIQSKISVGQPQIGKPEKDNVLECLQSGWITQGPYVEQFERAFADFIGVDHAVAVCNGTAALHLMLEALHIGYGDEVIVPALTFVATVNAITYTGATPVFADVKSGTWCVDPKDVEKKINGRTRAILAVHLYGSMADMAALGALAKHYDLVLLEDAAEALGAKQRLMHAGRHGKAGAFSFYGNKTITTGEGGMITTEDAALAKRLRSLRGHAQSETRRYWHEGLGYNYRMTDLQGALGCGQMGRIFDILDWKASIAQTYKSRLESKVEFQKTEDGDVHGNWATVVLLPEGIDREMVAQSMAAHGVETRPAFPLISKMPMYQYFAINQALPISEDVSKRGLMLPNHPGLISPDVHRVAEVLLEAIHG